MADTPDMPDAPSAELPRCALDLPVWWGGAGGETPAALDDLSLEDQLLGPVPRKIRTTRFRFLLRLLALYATPKGTLAGMSESLGYNPDYFANVVQSGYLPESALTQLRIAFAERGIPREVLRAIEADGV